MGSLDAVLGAVGRRLLAARWALPGALTTYFAFVGGGYFPGAVGLAAVIVLAIVAVVALTAARPLHGWGLGVAAAAVPLGGLALWAYASSSWSGSPGRAGIEASRVLLYLALLLTCSSLGWTAGRARGLLLGLLAAAVIVSLVGTASQLLPALFHVDRGPGPARLTYPVSYWNAMGLLAGIGCILAVHAASSLEERLWIRCLAAASTPVLAATLFLTVSRGALWSSAVGLVIYIVIAHPRGLPGAALAIVPTTLVALLSLQHGAVVQVSPDLIERYHLGGQPAWLIGGSMVVAGLLRVSAAPLDHALAGIRVRRKSRRIVLTSSVAGLAFVALLAVIVAHQLNLGRVTYDRFVAGVTPTQSSAGVQRFTDLSNDNRLSKWRVALDTFRADPLHGSGAGTYELSWLRERPTAGFVRDAHSLYVETLGELGLPGLILLVGALASMLVGLLLRARGPSRAAPAALLGAAAAWAISAGFDWDWEMPVVTAWVFAAGGLALARSADAKPRLSGRRGIVVRGVMTAACLAVAVLPLRVTLSEAAVENSAHAAARGDCQTVEGSAHRALSAMGGRWEPWQLLGYCAVRAGRYRAAQQDFVRAAQRDTENWLPRWSEAVAEAARGHNPSSALRAAAERNPRGVLGTELFVAATRNAKRPALRRAGRQASLPLP